jgi:DedD protein
LAELTHHDADDGFHEIQLSGKQLVFLFMLASSLAVAIFLCGVQVGRNVRSDRSSVADATDTLASATATPDLSAASTPSQPAASSSGPPAAEPPAPAAEPDDDLSYAKRLQADAAPAEKLKTPSDPPTPKSQQAAKSPETAKPQPPPKPVETAKATPPAVASTGRAGQWIVQVISLQDRAAADKFARRLSGKGYPAFVLDPSAGAPRIFRVQVGGYTNKDDAEQAARRLEKDEQLKPLVRSR